MALRAYGLRASPDDQADLARSSTTTTAGAATGETIHTTANHPWLTTDRGWVPAGDLHAGEPVRTLDGQIATVAWVHTVPGQADYYNLTVADDHTYAVGDGQYVVHTANCFGGKNGNTPEANLGQKYHYDRFNGGNADNYGGPSQLQDVFPSTQFRFNPRGVEGPDVEVVGGQHPSTYGRSSWPAGANKTDFKPAMCQGRAELRSQEGRNPSQFPPDTMPIWYDQGTYSIVGIGWG